jgi:hypothetical protein
MFIYYIRNFFNILFNRNQKNKYDDIFQPGELVFPEDIEYSTVSLTYSTEFSLSF